MANEIFKELKTRIALKQNTYQYWTEGEGKNYTPLYGEVCLCEIPAPETNVEQQTNGAQHATNAPTVLFKVGTAKKNADGSWVEGTNKTFSQLNWVSALAADVYVWAKAADVELINEKLTFRGADGTVIKEVDLSTFATDAIVGDLSNLNTATKTDLVSAINEVRQAVEVGGTGSVVTVAKLATPTEGSAATYQLYQGTGEDGKPTPVGDKIEIPVSTKVEKSEQNGYIKVDDEEVKVFDDVFKADGKTVVAAGGIAAGSEVNGKTFQQILYNMMYPYQKPTISASASPNGGTYMKGNTQTITSVTATVTKNTEEIAKVELYNGSTLVATKNGDDTLSSSSTSLVKNGGAVKFEGLSREVSANGGQYKAKVYDITGGTAEANTGSFSFINPYYYGVCGASATLDEALIESLTKDLSGKASKTYSYTTSAQRMVIAYPKSYGVIKLVKDGNGLDNTGAFGSPVTVSVTNEYGVTEDYYVYTNGVTSGSAKMTFSY